MSVRLRAVARETERIVADGACRAPGGHEVAAAVAIEAARDGTRTHGPGPVEVPSGAATTTAPTATRSRPTGSSTQRPCPSSRTTAAPCSTSRSRPDSARPRRRTPGSCGARRRSARANRGVAFVRRVRRVCRVRLRRSSTAAGAPAARAERVLDVAAAHGYRRPVLGAWGCGVFQNDPVQVAGAFRALLRPGGRFAQTFEHGVFGALDRTPGAVVRNAFARAFSLPRREP
ncbi:TIGR02452 family protein [Streptomyces sp. NPDC056161]|uniref:TIGR02452 family protein n=1 Tax=Streptomyces sp. NPDC056161 TaxID=3345732 RepID=UPI0035E1C9F4